MSNHIRGTYDVVIIGSGFGGAVNGCRLAQSGRSVCILERGKRWNKSDFPRTSAQMVRAFWNPTDLGLLDYRIFRRLDVIQASGVGGGSLVYFNVNCPPPRKVFDSPKWPKSINLDTLETYYQRSREMLEAKPFVPPQGRTMPTRTDAFFEAAKGSGRDPMLMHIAVYTGPERLNPYSGITQDGCVYCGNCMLGCHVHAKNTLDLNYLPVAEQNGAELFPLHQAERIEPLEGGGYRVHFKTLGPGGESGSVVGRKLILAAGTLGTNELLLRSRDLHRTLPRLGKMLGKGFSINGDFLLDGTKNAKRIVDPVPGPGITGGVDCSTDENGIFISDMGYPEPWMWFLEGTLPYPSRILNTLGAAWTYISRTLGLSKPSDYTVGMNRFFGGTFSPHYLPYLGMATDAANGTLRLSGGNIEIDWSHSASREVYRQMEKAIGEFSRALGGKYSTSFYWRWPLRKRFTAHPLGGCHLSESPETGVVDEWGEVWGYPNLYVADASIIPTALGVAPTATIAALSERIAEHIAAS